MAAAIRPVVAADAPAIAAIYGWYVAHSAITFEEAAPDEAEIARRIAATAPLPWLVAEAEGALSGYAYAHLFHPRVAYRWTCETTIYLAPQARGCGVGRALYAALLDRLAAAGYASAVALVTEPNEASAALHARLGFARAGLLRGVGFKHGRWHDVAYWQRDLAPRAVPPPQPR